MAASGREKGPRLEALRAFLIAITPEEHATRTDLDRLDERRRTLEQDISHRTWEVDRMQKHLLDTLALTALNVTENPLFLEVMRKAANDRLLAVTKTPTNEKTDLATAREELRAAQSEHMWLCGELIRVQTSTKIEDRRMAQIKAELPALSYSKAEAASPICPVCEVPIDRALAEGCKLSHKLPDLSTCQQRWKQRQTEFESQQSLLRELRSEETKLTQQTALARQRLDRISQRVGALERARDAGESCLVRGSTATR